MRDPFNPTHTELLEWAYDPIAVAPVQDFHIMIAADLANVPLFVQLADDERCPKRWYFLNCLYLFVGDTVRFESRFPGKARQQLSFLGELLAPPWTGSWPPLQRWVERTIYLLDHPDTFDYVDWCDSGIIIRDRAEYEITASEG